MSITTRPIPGARLLTPADHTLIMIDFQSQMAFATRSVDGVMLRSNAALVAHSQAGARPMTSLQYLLELQRDWARAETYDMTTGIAKQSGGSYGLGIVYAKAMFAAHEA
jgi:nicotinamidase-related amidase